MSGVTRRSFIGKTAIAIRSVTALQKVLGTDRSGNDPGPSNPGLDAQNPDSMWPPGTDSKSLVQNFKYPFSFANKRVYEGGWSREVTVRELPVSKTLAGVKMRLTAGGVRELHWHTSAEWAIMLYGTARITAIDADGKSFVADVGKNDLWFFPSGIPHSIQGLGLDGCELMLAFDDGDFSESDTVLLSADPFRRSNFLCSGAAKDDAPDAIDGGRSETEHASHFSRPADDGERTSALCSEQG